jgi:hypothetical protein
MLENISIRLFLLPKESDKIVDFLLLEPWVIIATQDSLLFLHT